MDYDLDEFLEEYDDFTSQVEAADYSLFHSRLAQWVHLVTEGDQSISGHIEYLLSKRDKTYIFSDVFGLGKNNPRSVRINMPSNKLDRLSANLVFFVDLSNKKIDLLAFCVRAYSSRDINSSLDQMVQTIFSPFASELRRFIEKNYDEPTPDDFVQPEPPQSVPASDRVVPINHNEPEFIKISDLLKSVEEDIRGINDTDPEIKDRALSELRAANEVIHARSARYDLLKTLLLGCLKWLAIKFADNAVSIAITTLLGLVTAFFGFPM